MTNPELVRFPLADGGSVLVEMDVQPGVSPAGRASGVLREARTTFEKAIAEVRDAAAGALAQFTTMARAPDEVELKFGIKLDAEVGAIIARTGIQGQFEVKLRWQREGSTQDRWQREESAQDEEQPAQVRVARQAAEAGVARHGTSRHTTSAGFRPAASDPARR